MLRPLSPRTRRTATWSPPKLCSEVWRRGKKHWSVERMRCAERVRPALRRMSQARVLFIVEQKKGLIWAPPLDGLAADVWPSPSFIEKERPGGWDKRRGVFFPLLRRIEARSAHRTCPFSSDLIRFTISRSSSPSKKQLTKIFLSKDTWIPSRLKRDDRRDGGPPFIHLIHDARWPPAPLEERPLLHWVPDSRILWPQQGRVPVLLELLRP